MKLASCKSALNATVVYSTDRSKALILTVCCFVVYSTRRFVYVLPCVILFLCFSVLLALQLPRLGTRELILVLFVLLFVCACLDLSVSSSSWCLGRAAVCNLGTYLFFDISNITKTYLYNFEPLKPHFYTVKLGFAGIYIFFLISAQKHRLWVLVRTALLRRFYRVPTIYVLSRNMKNIRVFYLKIFSVWR